MRRKRALVALLTLTMLLSSFNFSFALEDSNDVGNTSGTTTETEEVRKADSPTEVTDEGASKQSEEKSEDEGMKALEDESDDGDDDGDGEESTMTFVAHVIFEGQAIGSDAELAERPDKVTLTLQAKTEDGEWTDVGTYPVTADDYNDNLSYENDASKRIYWTKEISDLPMTDEDGNALSYRVVQSKPGTVYIMTSGDPIVDDVMDTTTQEIYNTYQENWNYKVGLRWSQVGTEEYYEREVVTIETTHNTPSAILTINTQKTYAPGKLEARIPRYLFGKTGILGKTVNDIGVGPEDDKSAEEKFTYYIDDMGTPNDPYDDEIVFYNYKEFEAGENFNVEIGYDIDPTLVVDCEVGTAQVKATGQYDGQPDPEELETRTIQFRMDTGAKFTNSGSTRNTSGKSIYYEEHPSIAVGRGTGFSDYDFDNENYNYMIFDVGSNDPSSTKTRGNQKYKLTTDITLNQDGGEIVAASGLTAEQIAAARSEDDSNVYNLSSNPQYILVRYPREQTGTDEDGNATYDKYYSVNADIHLICTDEHKEDKVEGEDFNDTDVVHVFADGTYHDYEFRYDGAIYGGSKYNYQGFQEAALSHLEAGRDVSTNYNLTAHTYGYDRLPDGFRMELDDDGVFVRARGRNGLEDYVRLTEEDYYFDTTNATVLVTYNDVDRTNGKTINKLDELQGQEFTIWAKESVDGDWIQVATKTIGATGSFVIPEAAGYVGVRIVSPEGLTGHLGMSVSGMKTTFLHTSPILSDYASRSVAAEDDFVSGLDVTNLSAVRGYVPNEDGEYEWGNRSKSSTNSVAAATGMDAIDQEEDMGYQLRYSTSNSMGRLSLTGGMTKDVEHETSMGAKKIYVKNTLNSYEQLSGKYSDWSESLHEENELKDGVFFDLLPEGYEYNAAVTPTVTSGSLTGSANAIITSIETIDDYESTGRQMVIFHVKTGYTTDEDGEDVSVTNWQDMGSYHRSYFRLTFGSVASYQDTKSGIVATNYSAFQREEGGSLNAASNSDFKAGDNNIYKLDGSPAYWQDADGWHDGVSNTRYAQDSHTAVYKSAYEAGLIKQVKADSQMYQRDDIATVGKTYSYRLRYMPATEGTVTKNIVIYDILETALNAGGNSGEPGMWQGTYVSCNVNALKRMGIAPVVWYSTQSGLKYDNFEDASYVPEEHPEHGWTREEPEDPSTVTAIAFDVRKAADDSNFELPAKTQISMEITMLAPDELQPYEYAYNMPAYNSITVSKGTGEEDQSFNQGNRTTVRLQLPQNMDFKKYYMDEEGELGEAGATYPVVGATFKLYKCNNTDANHEHNDGDANVLPGTSKSCYKEVTRIVTDEDGNVDLSGLTSGDYAIRETKSPTGWDAPKSYWTFSVNAFRGTHTDPELVTVTVGDEPEEDVHEFEKVEDTEDSYTLEDNRSKRDIPVQKIWQGGSNGRTDSVQVQLYRDGEEFGEPRTLDKSNEWQTSFDDLYRYSLADGHEYEYTVKEITDIPGFEKEVTEDTSSLKVGANTEVVFSDDSMTEARWDFVSFIYQDEDGLWNILSVSGYLGGRTLVVPSNQVYIAWNTDGSGTRTGFTIESLQPTTDDATPEFTTGYSYHYSGSYSASNPMAYRSESFRGGLTSFPNYPYKQGSTFTSTDTIKAMDNAKTVEDDTVITKRSNGTGDTKYFGSRSTDLWYYEGGIAVNDKAVGVINTRLGNLEIHKNVENNTANRDDTFVFDVTFTDQEGNPITQELTYHWYASRTATNADVRTITPDEDGHVSFNLKNGQWVRFIDLPIDAKYAVSEGQTRVSSIYETKTDFERNGSVTTNYPTDGAIENNVASGTATSGGLPTVRFTNTYTPGKARLNVPVEKVITGNDRSESSERDFTFRIERYENTTAPLPSSTTTTVHDEGTGAFGTITFTKAGTYQYKITEVAGSDTDIYDYSTEEHIVTVTVVDEDGALFASWELDGQEADEASKATFTNDYHPVPTEFEIPVEKVIEGNDTPTDKAFTFQLTGADDDTPMPDSDTATITGQGSDVFGSIEYTQAGTYTYTVKEVKGDETGYTYSTAEHTVVVTVTDNNGHLEATWTLDGSETDADSKASFTNTYDPEDVNLAIPVKKLVNGNARPQGGEQRFKFTLTALGDAPKPKKSTLYITDEGEANFGDITFTEAGTYTYELAETDGKVDGYTYDTEKRTITVVVTDNDGVLEQNWSVDVDRDTEDDGITFANKYEVDPITIAAPVVKKDVTGQDRPEEYTFTFVIEGSTDDTPMPEEDTVSVTGIGSTAFGSITYEHAGTYYYTIREPHGPSDNGYSYDQSEHTMTVVVTDTDSVLSAVVKIDGKEIADGERGEVEFTNHYEPKAAVTSIPVTKEVTGQVRPEEKTFTFTLVGENDETPMPERSTVTITGNGSNIIGEITYAKAGEYHYTLTEQDDGRDGYTYDDTVYNITVTVTDNNGTLTAAQSIQADTTSVNEVKFTNEYEPVKTRQMLQVRKGFTGQTRPTEKEFTFNIAAQDNAPMPIEDTVKVTGEGVAKFPAITFTEAGTYRYTVTEQRDRETGYTYDETEYEVVVVVVDNDGKLNATWSLENEDEEGNALTEMKFTNDYTPESTTFEIPVSKSLDGQDRPEEQTFTFTLVGTDDDTPMPETDTVKITGEGQVEFPEITYTEAGTYEYTLTEQNDGKTGYSYDGTEYQVVVTVTDNDGELEAEMTLKNTDSNGDALDSIEFLNTYVPVPTTVELPISKRIDGHDRPIEKTFTFNINAESSNAPMPSKTSVTITDEGEATFPEIKFTEAGTYEYEITEVDSGENSYTYDSEKFKVVVEVVDVEGELQATWSLENKNEEGEALTEIEFVNEYVPKETDVVLPVEKVIEGPERPLNKDFSFEIQAKDGAPLPEETTVTVTNEGEVEFPEITFIKAGTYEYTVTELDTKENGYTYDSTEYEVVVTVVDNDGNLEATWSLKNVDEEGEALKDIVFTNVYGPHATTLAIPVEKIIDGPARSETEEFTFELQPVTEDAPMPEESTVTITDEGVKNFSAITFDQTGTFEYTLRELEGDSAEYTYDDAIHELKAVVTDIDGDLQVEWYLDGRKMSAEDEDTVVFTNVYTPEDAGVDTSDQNNMTLWFTLMSLAAAALLGILGFRRRQEN